MPSVNGSSATYNPPTILGADGRPARGNDGASLVGDGFAIPQVISFVGMLQGAWAQYWPHQWDQSRVIGHEFHLTMMHQPHLMALLRERWRAVRKLKWHIAVDDERDPTEAALRDGMTRLVRNIPRLKRLMFSLQWATWYGRAGAQVTWEWQENKLPGVKRVTAVPGLPQLGTKPAPARPDAPAGIAGQPMASASPVDESRRCCVLARHEPVNGDKILYKHDHTPIILVNAGKANELKGAEIENTPVGGKGVVLRGGWRNRFVIHQHECLDQDFNRPEMADAIHGAGVRDVLAWSEWMRQEWLADLCTFLERVGLGVKLWYYPAGNPTAQKAAQAAASKQTDRTNLLVPVYGDNQRFPSFEMQETPTGGAQVLLQLIQHQEYWQQRYIAGQTLFGPHAQSGGVGGGDAAEAREGQQDDLIIEDAENLAETLTGSDREPGVLSVMYRYTWPELVGRVRCPRFEFDCDLTSPEKRLNAVKTFIGMGGKVIEKEARAMAGLSEPQEGDDVLGGQQAVPGGPGDDGSGEGGNGPGGGANGQGKPPEKPGRDLTDKPPAATEYAAVVLPLAYAAEAGRWITIGGSKGEGGKRSGGTPVFIVGGRITKGAPSLRGKKIDALHEDAPELSGRKAQQDERSYARAKYAKEAKAQGVDPKALHQLAAEMIAHHKEGVDDKNAMLREARKALEHFGGKHRTIQTGRVEQGDVPHLDEVAEDLAQKYPYAFNMGQNWTDQLHDMLTAGNAQPMSEDDAYDQAMTHLLEEKRQADYVPFQSPLLPVSA